MGKPSFFEKLTGASWSQDEDMEERISSVKSSGAKKTKPAKAKPAVKSSPAKPKRGAPPASMPIVEDKPAKEKKEKDWLGESEGQLTIDVYQTPAEIVIKSTIAGVGSEDIDITMNNDMITIKGMRHKDEDVVEEDYYYQECYWGPFSRSIILPVDVEVDQVRASMKNGILTIRLPKIEKAQTKKISIETE